MTSPVLLHIGYHKTGTKWLRAALFEDASTGYRLISKERRPVRGLVRERPLDFDAGRTREQLRPLLEDARGAGAVPVVCWGRLAGHAYSGGHDSKEIAARLHAVFPEARILVVVREQRSMIFSTYKQYVRTGGVCTLEQFLHPAAERGWRIPGFDFAYFEYDALIRHYRSLYGADAVLAIPYEQLVRDRRGFLTAIAAFGGRPLEGEALERAVGLNATNKGKSALALTARRRVNRFGRRTELNPAPLLESRRIFALGTRVRKKAKLPDSAPARALAARSEDRLRRAVAEAVADRYVESNRRTAELTGIDLGAYGWMV